MVTVLVKNVCGQIRYVSRTCYDMSSLGSHQSMLKTQYHTYINEQVGGIYLRKRIRVFNSQRNIGQQLDLKKVPRTCRNCTMLINIKSKYNIVNIGQSYACCSPISPCCNSVCPDYFQPRAYKPLTIGYNLWLKSFSNWTSCCQGWVPHRRLVPQSTRTPSQYKARLSRYMNFNCNEKTVLSL